MKEEQIHVGKLIEAYMKEHHITKTEFARRYPYCRQHVYDILHSPSLQFQQIKRISEILGHNFFDDINELMNKEAV